MSRRFALEFSFIAMEALAFFVLAAVLTGASGEAGIAYPALLAAEAGGFYLVRGLFHVELARRTLVVAGGAISFYALLTIGGLAFAASSFPPGWAALGSFLSAPTSTLSKAGPAVIYGVVLLCVVWARGVFGAQERLERERALRSFSLGLLVLLLGLLFGEESAARGAVNGASLPLIAFGLLTLALIRLRDARAEGDDPLRGPWLLIAGGTIGGLVLAGAAIGVLPLGPAGFVYDHAIGPALGLALLVISWVVLIVVYPIAWLVAQILNLIIGGIHFKPVPPQQASTSEAASAVRNGVGKGPAAVFVVLLQILAVIAVVATLSYLAYRLFSRLHRPPPEGEERESLAGEGSLRGDLAALWRHLRPHRSSARPETVPDLPSGVLQVRRLYLRLLRRAEDRGSPRPASATPLEFQPVLGKTLASPAPVDVTAAFDAARYGRIVPTDVELRRLEEDVARLT